MGASKPSRQIDELVTAFPRQPLSSSLCQQLVEPGLQDHTTV